MATEGNGTASGKGAKVKPTNFCILLHHLLENPTDPEHLRWVDGEVDQFQISVNEEKALAALRPTFDFKSMSSFVRQLSYYDFKRLSDRRKSNERRSESKSIVFMHQSGLFVRGNPANVEKMKRKLRIRAERSRRASAVSVGSAEEDQPQSASPLFSPTSTSWTSGEVVPPLPTPPLPHAFTSSMGAFAISAPSHLQDSPTTGTNGAQPPKWQPYSPSEIPAAFSQQPLHAAPGLDAARFAPYPRAQQVSDRRASAVSIGSDASNLSPRCKSAELGFYPAVAPPRHSPSLLGPGASGSTGPVFRHPFADQSFPSPSAQPSQYFSPVQRPAASSPTTLLPTVLSSGLPAAYDLSCPQSASTSALPSPADSAYPSLSSLKHYRIPSSGVFNRTLHTPPQGPLEQKSVSPISQPHLGFRNHLRFNSVPTQPPCPYPHYTPPRTDEYLSPTSVSEEELARAAALEARRTSYPFPRPLSTDDPAPAPYDPPQSLTTSSGWTSVPPPPAEPYYSSDPHEANVAGPLPVSLGNTGSWYLEQEQLYGAELPDSMRNSTIADQHYESQPPYYTTDSERYVTFPLHEGR
ncbi:uncharacterized protein JCM15063_004940 [Sporobolomyces koalae]|uniref:uncharacterized protein n=1 Tax=Sporobolomyces koalae TaxID=500713 RepID=UPI0031782262